jgi:hypothetical protein
MGTPAVKKEKKEKEEKKRKKKKSGRESFSRQQLGQRRQARRAGVRAAPPLTKRPSPY